jgi:hypothetical protein
MESKYPLSVFSRQERTGLVSIGGDQKQPAMERPAVLQNLVNR